MPSHNIQPSHPPRWPISAAVLKLALKRVLKPILIILAIALYFPLQGVGVTPVSLCRDTVAAASSHLLFHFSHANVFHLLANCLCLYLIKFPVKVIPSLVLATLVSFLPCPTWQWSTLSFEFIPVCGLSACILAAIGIAWGEVSTFRKMCTNTLIPVALFSLLPNINLLIHLYALLAGFFYAKAAALLRMRWLRHRHTSPL